MPQPRTPLPAASLAALAVLAGRQGGAVTWRQVLDSGVTAAQARTQVRRGAWSAAGRGVLLLGEVGLVPHLAECGARLLQLRRRAVVSHASAGLLLGLPYVDAPHLPTVTVERATRGEPGVYVASFRAGDVTHVGGLPVMTPARTLVDLMRTAPGRGRAQGLADGALRHGAPAGEVSAALAAAHGWPGIRQAREAWEHVDERAESPLESLCRVWFRDGGLPEPELQVLLRAGRRVARVDFLFRDQRTVVEADGRVKYDDRTVLWDEKVREDGLREEGFEVVRATWGDRQDDGADLCRRVRRAFDRAGSRAA